VNVKRIKIIARLSAWYHKHNELGRHFKTMAEIVEEKEAERGGVLPRIYFRVCSKDEVRFSFFK